jgi:flagellar biosynthetic protein FlhB
MDEPRTESASPRKLARARQQGIVPKSQDLVAAAVLFALLFSLLVFGGRLLHALQALLARALDAAAAPHPPGPGWLLPALYDFSLLALVPLLAIVLAALLANVLQIGPLWASKNVVPDWKRAEPRARLREIFSVTRWLEVLIALSKLCAVLAVATFALLRATRVISTLGSGSAARALFTLCALSGKLVLYLASTAALLGLGDLIYRRMQHARQLRMTRRELTDEQHETSGRPEQRQARRRVQAEAEAYAAAVALAGARVLLFDSEERALALAYDPEHDGAPRIVQKAQGELALRVRAQAEREAIALRFAPGLVAALFALELTEEVPRAQHAALAELMREMIASGEFVAVSGTDTTRDAS